MPERIPSAESIAREAERWAADPAYVQANLRGFLRDLAKWLRIPAPPALAASVPERAKKQRIVIECRDFGGSIERLLRYIQATAGIGHSFDIVVDPEDREFRKTFFIDGDGADKIYSVEVTDHSAEPPAPACIPIDGEQP